MTFTIQKLDGDGTQIIPRKTVMSNPEEDLRDQVNPRVITEHKIP